MWFNKFGIAAAMISAASCTSKLDVMNQPPMLDRVFLGDYIAAAACVQNAIQTANYTISPTVLYIPGPDYAEIQTTASSGLTGTIYGQVTRIEKHGTDSWRAVVRAAYTADGDVAVSAVNKCSKAVT